nr:hypothetical protein [uncultured Acetobacterium sp.]
MKQSNRPPAAISVILLFFSFGCFFATGYGITFMIYHWTGMPSKFWAHIISCLVGMALIISVASVSRLIAGKYSKGIQQHHIMQNQLLNAMT